MPEDKTVSSITLSDAILYNDMTNWLHVFILLPAQEYFTEGLQNVGLCSVLRAFEQGGIFIVPHLLWHGASVFFRSHPKEIQSPLTTHMGM
jgi:hypothetical protein